MASFQDNPATPRLQFNRFGEADADDLAAILADPEVTRHITANGSTAERCAIAARNRIAWHNADWADKGYGVWALRSRQPDIAPPEKVIGWCGFVPPDIDADEPEILYGLAREVWGIGLGQEAARAAISWLFDTTALAGVSAIISTELNPASVKVVTKLGMTQRGTLAFTDFLPDKDLAQDVLAYEQWRLAEGHSDDLDALVFQSAYRAGQLMAVCDANPATMERDLVGAAARRMIDATKASDAVSNAFKAGMANPTMDWYFLDRQEHPTTR